MSCRMCNKLLHHYMCELCNISEPFPLPWHRCSHTCTCGLITYVSHINTISPLRVVTQLPKPNKDLSAICWSGMMSRVGRRSGLMRKESEWVPRSPGRWQIVLRHGSRACTLESVAPTSEPCPTTSANQIESLGGDVLLGRTMWASCYLVCSVVQP